MTRWIRRVRPGPEAWIEVGELAQRLRAEEELFVVDVRGADEFEGSLGHIPGARHIPLDEMAERIREVEAGKPIVLVCKTDRRSAAGAKLLRDRGFREVRVLRGGMVEWNDAGLAVERSAQD